MSEQNQQHQHQPSPSPPQPQPQPQANPAKTTTLPNDHAPRGTAQDQQHAILSRLPRENTLGRTISLAVPRLVHDFRLSAKLDAKIGLGPSCWGERNWIGIVGGDWAATWGKGRIVPGGQDAQLLVPDTKATFVDTRYLLVTEEEEGDNNDDDDETAKQPRQPAHIMVRTEGWRTGPADVLTRLLDPIEGDKVDPSEYRFRLFVRLETGDARYRWVNESMWIGSGVRRGAEVIYDGYRLL